MADRKKKTRQKSSKKKKVLASLSKLRERSSKPMSEGMTQMLDETVSHVGNGGDSISQVNSDEIGSKTATGQEACLDLEDDFERLDAILNWRQQPAQFLIGQHRVVDR